MLRRGESIAAASLLCDQDGRQAHVSDLLMSFVPRMTALARQSLKSRRNTVVDEDDIASMALASFCQAIARGRYSEFEDEKRLWSCLATITRRKVIDHVRKEQVRSSQLTVSLSCVTDPRTQNDDPAEIAGAREELRRKRCNVKTSVPIDFLEYELSGETKIQLAERYDVSVRTVERWFSELRKALAS